MSRVVGHIGASKARGWDPISWTCEFIYTIQKLWNNTRVFELWWKIDTESSTGLHSSTWWYSKSYSGLEFGVVYVGMTDSLSHNCVSVCPVWLKKLWNQSSKIETQDLNLELRAFSNLVLKESLDELVNLLCFLVSFEFFLHRKKIHVKQNSSLGTMRECCWRRSLSSFDVLHC